MFRRGLGWVLLHSFLVQLTTFLIRPTTSYRALEDGLPSSVLGVLSASFALVPLVLAIGVGRLTDRWGERWIATAGGVALCACPLVLLVWSGVPALVAGTVLLGTGHLLCMVSEQALVANTTDAPNRDRTFGYYTFAASAGQVAGPGVIAAVGGSAASPDTTVLFAIAAVPAAAALVVGLLFRRSATTTATDGSAVLAGRVRDLLGRAGVLPALLSRAVVLAAVDITLAYFPALGQERGWSAATVSVLLVVRAATSMVSRLFLGRLVAAWGRQRLLLVSVAASAVTIGVLVAPLSAPAAIAVVAVAGLALGMCQPLTMSWVADLAPPGQRGTAMSLRITGNRLGQVLLPSLAGLMAAGSGAVGVLGATGVALGVTAGALVAAARHR